MAQRGPLTALVLALIAAGCDDAGPPGADLGPARDAAQDLDALTQPDQAGPDLPADLAAEADQHPAEDTGAAPDLPTLVKRTILFARGKYTAAMTLATIQSDGTGYKKVPGFDTLDLTGSTLLRGQVSQHLPITRDIPQEDRRLKDPPIVLPRGLGYLKWYCATGASKVGVMVLRPTGGVEALFAVAGPCSGLSRIFAVSTDGNLAATHRPGVGVVLVRTNQTVFGSGKPFVELKPGSAAGYLYPESVTLAGKRVLFITRAGAESSQHTLWSAPTDGTAQPAAVPLPQVGGASPEWIDDEIAQSESGNLAVVTAGSYTSVSASTKEDVIAIDLAAGKATNLTSKPADYGPRFYSWGYSGAGPQLAVSPSGTHVAYVHRTSSTVQHLWVVRADGTAAAAQVTSTANVSASEIQVQNLSFIDDSNLLFTAFASSYDESDIFRYNVTTKTLGNVTQSGGPAKPPFSLQGAMIVRGIWRAPNGKHLYYVHHATPSGTLPTADIVAIDLSTYKTTWITKGAEVPFTPDGYAACPAGSTLFFAAEPKAAKSHRQELFVFDMDQPAAAIQLSALTTGTYWDNHISDINPSPGCDVVAFRGGTTSIPRMAVAQVTAPVSILKVPQAPSSTGSYAINDYHLFSPDGAMLVFCSGVESYMQDMLVVPARWPASPQVVIPFSPLYTAFSQVYAVW